MVTLPQTTLPTEMHFDEIVVMVTQIKKGHCPRLNFIIKSKRHQFLLITSCQKILSFSNKLIFSTKLICIFLVTQN